MSKIIFVAGPVRGNRNIPIFYLEKDGVVQEIFD